MSKKALEDFNYEIIKAHCLCPEESPLPVHQQKRFNRARSIAKILDGNPIVKNAIAIHMKLYPEISLTTAYEDYHLSLRIFQTFRTFDYDSWHTFMINDIVETIQKLKKHNTVAALKTIILAHSVLKKVVGEKPEEIQDPERNEKHQFFIIVQNNVKQIKIDVSKLKDLPDGILQDFNPSLWAGEEITDIEAEEIMTT
jgi:hypothetical protein